MRTRLEWFVVPCVASMFAGNAITVNAQDAPKSKRNINFVWTNETDDWDAKTVRDRVAKELENSGVSEEIKAKIMKDVEAALNTAAKEIGKRGKSAAKKAEDAVENAKEGAKQSEGASEQALKSQQNRWTTQLFRDPKGESFQIGVQCVQVSDEDGDEAAGKTQGLEVKAVFDSSPANKAGIAEGDVLLSVDLTRISTIADLTSALQSAGMKDAEVVIELKREGEKTKVKVKPTKMKSADLELESIRLAFPTEGFVVGEEEMKKYEGQQMKKWIPSVTPNGGAQMLGLNGITDAVKKDMDELKSELAEMKKMIREIAKAMGENK